MGCKRIRSSRNLVKKFRWTAIRLAEETSGSENSWLHNLTFSGSDFPEWSRREFFKDYYGNRENNLTRNLKIPPYKIQKNPKKSKSWWTLMPHFQ